MKREAEQKHVLVARMKHVHGLDVIVDNKYNKESIMNKPSRPTEGVTTMKSSREEYERNLKRIQEEHLRNLEANREMYWKPCMHDQCASCHGTGVKSNGASCIHLIYCDCPKCAVHC